LPGVGCGGLAPVVGGVWVTGGGAGVEGFTGAFLLWWWWWLNAWEPTVGCLLMSWLWVTWGLKFCKWRVPWWCPCLYLP